MILDKFEQPRCFTVGKDGKITLKHTANITLETDELVTFIRPNGKEHDFTAKSWGYYATPSINGRLKKNGFKTALVLNPLGQLFIMTVDSEQVGSFMSYLEEGQQRVLEWLDERQDEVKP